VDREAGLDLKRFVLGSSSWGAVSFASALAIDSYPQHPPVKTCRCL